MFWHVAFGRLATHQPIMVERGVIMMERLGVVTVGCFVSIPLQCYCTFTKTHSEKVTSLEFRSEDATVGRYLKCLHHTGMPSPVHNVSK